MHIVARGVAVHPAAIRTLPAVKSLLVPAYEQIGNPRFRQNLRHLQSPARHIRIISDMRVAAGQHFFQLFPA